MHAPYKGQEPKKGFVCVFATSCEISFRDIPKIIRVSNIIPWPTTYPKFCLSTAKNMSGRWANIISNSFGTKFSCAEHRILKLRLKNLTSKAISVDASHWSAYESGIADFCNPVSWENQWVGPGGVCFFFLVTRTWRKNRANGKMRNLRNMAENHANDLGRKIGSFYIYGIVHLYFHFG